MTNCFMSYATEDRVFVQGLATRVREFGHFVWVDYKDIPGGTDWETEIQKGIRESHYLLVVITPHSIDSEWVKREIHLAKEQGKEIIPLLVYKVAMPESLEKLGISHLQCFDFLQDGYEGALHKLLDTISIHMDTRKRKALVIEDEDTFRQSIARILESMGVSVTQAKSFRSAFQQVRADQFDVVTLDMQLSDMDQDGAQGMELLDQIQIYQRGVPIIIISGLDWKPKDVRDFLVEYGAFDFLQKPLRPADLRHALEAALNKSA